MNQQQYNPNIQYNPNGFYGPKPDSFNYGFSAKTENGLNTYPNPLMNRSHLSDQQQINSNYFGGSTNTRSPNTNRPDFNSQMNNIVRNQIISRGKEPTLNQTNLHSNNYNNSPNSSLGKQEESIRKKMLLENIQEQMLMHSENNKNNKQKKYQDDLAYLNNIKNYYPFGRGGAGAPNRDKNGNVITNRRRLISDPKYQHYNIQYNDDYDEVWNSSKPGVATFASEERKKTPFAPHPSYLGNQQSAQINPYSSLIQPQISYPESYHPLNANQENYAYQQRQPSTNQWVPMTGEIQPPPYQLDFNSNNQAFDQQQNMQNIPPMQPLMQQPPMQPMMMQPQLDMNDPNIYNVSVSYNNNDIDPEFDHKKKKYHGEFLKSQINEKAERKKKEQEEKRREELIEEERLKKEREDLMAKLKQEEDRRRRLKEDTDRANQIKSDKAFNHIRPASKKVQFEVREPEEPKINAPQIVIENSDPTQDEKVRKELADQIIRFKNQISEQQSQVLNMVADLKNETQQANLQRYEALKEISYLKEEISKTRIEDELRRKYVYDVMIDNNNNINSYMGNTKMPEAQPSEYKYDENPGHKQNMKNMMYDNSIRYPSRLQVIPKLEDDGDQEMRARSEYIDIDTHRLMEGKGLYMPKKIKTEEDEEALKLLKNKAIEFDKNIYLPLEDFYKKEDEVLSHNLNNHRKIREHDFKEVSKFRDKADNQSVPINKQSSETLEMEKVDMAGKEAIHNIYNKNLERLRWLNSLEEG